MRFFNTAGPVNVNKHYCLDPLYRIDLENLLSLIEQEKYFVLHAPRQTGKTSSMLALRDYLNAGDQYCCVYVNIEVAQSARENVTEAMQAILSVCVTQGVRINSALGQIEIKPLLEQSGAHHALQILLSRWSNLSSRPLVLIIDEIDALVGDSLISVLRQLRAGYIDDRPANFPQSVILCGVRDVRDYRIHSHSNKEIITGGSAFNIKARSLRIGNFTTNEIAELYAEHTQETGQIFTDEALKRAWELTRGQPWLVNALAYETCFEFKAGINRKQPITLELINEAKEALIIRCETHLDQLTDKLKELRVRQVIEPILSGERMQRLENDDVQYVLDLGLIDRINGQTEIANVIYREVIPRQLTYIQQLDIEPIQKTVWYIRADGKLDDIKLIAAFQEFFRENSEHWLTNITYVEAAPQLLMQAFLQRIVNGGGFIEREYGLGRGRTDLMIIWKYPDGVQKIVIELKILRKSLEKTINEGLTQTWEYLDRMEQGNGHLVIFDRSDKSWEEKIYQREEVFNGKKIMIWGM